MSTFQIKNSLLSSIMLLTLLLILINKVNSTQDSFSFSFTEFEPQQQDLIFQGDAVVDSSTGKLQLTKVENGHPVAHSLGRVLHHSPIQVWDSRTGKVASFTTSFTFTITAANESNTADGLAFFLAAADTQPKKLYEYLGLFDDHDYSTSNQVLAVEFDTYHNSFDPEGAHHIGIDSDSIVSSATTPWGFENGNEAHVTIRYDGAQTKVLTASLSYPSSQNSYVVSYRVDLMAVLPEFVRVGFSASSGNNAIFDNGHVVNSWSFKSKFSGIELGSNYLNNITDSVHVSSSGFDSI